jgi:hypothetical protein
VEILSLVGRVPAEEEVTRDMLMAWITKQMDLEPAGEPQGVFWHVALHAMICQTFRGARASALQAGGRRVKMRGEK